MPQLQDDVANMLHPIGNSIVLPDELLRATSNLVCDVQEKTMGLFFNMPKVVSRHSSVVFAVRYPVLMQVMSRPGEADHGQVRLRDRWCWLFWRRPCQPTLRGS